MYWKGRVRVRVIFIWTVSFDHLRTPEEFAYVEQTSFCGLVPGFEPRAIGLIAQMVTGQTGVL